MQSKELTQIFEAIDIACLKPVGSFEWKESHRFEFRTMDYEMALSIIEREAPRLGKQLSAIKAAYNAANAELYAAVDAAKADGDSNPWQCEAAKAAWEKGQALNLIQQQIEFKAGDFKTAALKAAGTCVTYGWDTGGCCVLHQERERFLQKMLWPIQKHLTRFPLPESNMGL